MQAADSKCETLTNFVNYLAFLVESRFRMRLPVTAPRMTSSIDSLHIDPNISRAWSLPAPFYTEPSVLALEHEKIFGKTWQVVGHSPGGGSR